MKKLNIKEQFSSKSFKAGGYSLAATAIVIVLVIALVLTVQKLPAKYTQIDTTAEGIYTLSEQSKAVTSALEEDVHVYLLAQSGNENQIVLNMLDLYESESKHFSYSVVDPIVSPNFASQYTDETVSENSLIVVSQDVSRYIPNEDIYVYTYTSYTEYTVDFDGESCLTSAISYVTNDSLPKIYYLTGHGEQTLPSSFSKAIERENAVLEELNLLTAGEIPEDAQAVISYAPQNDLSEEEAEALQNYLTGGGSLIAFTDYTDQALTNFEKIMENYGMKRTNGIVVEGNMNYCLSGYPHYLVPELISHTVTDPIINNNYAVLIPASGGLTATEDVRSTVTVSPLMQTTSEAYCKMNPYSETAEKEEGDTDGPFYLGMISTETVNSATATVVWFPCAGMLAEEINSYVGNTNYDLVINTVNLVCEMEESISIRAKNLSGEALTVTASGASLWSMIMVAVIPLGFIVAGTAVMIYRKKR